MAVYLGTHCTPEGEARFALSDKKEFLWHMEQNEGDRLHCGGYGQKTHGTENGRGAGPIYWVKRPIFRPAFLPCMSRFCLAAIFLVSEACLF